MGKPEWLVKHELERSSLKNKPVYCTTCKYRGTKILGYRRHISGEKLLVFGCTLHDKVRNSKYSLRCDDYKKMC